MKIYMLSGLGADGRIYDRLKRHAPGHEIIALPWKDPGKSKTIADYARLLDSKYTLEQPYILGGVSMGAMVAQEWARIRKPEGLILISTVCSDTDYPWLLRFASGSRLTYVLRKWMLIRIATIADKFTVKSGHGRSLFYDMLHSTEARVMEFGARATTAWKPCGTEVPVLRIHGTLDRVFPFRKIKTPVVPIEGGSHFMIVDRVGEVGAVIEQWMKLRCPDSSLFDPVSGK